MAITGKRMVAGSQITAAATTFYTVGASTRAQIQAMTITNRNAAARTVTIHLVPSGGTATDSNIILAAKSLNQDESYKVIEAIGQWLEAGGTIQALASAATSVNLVASGIEVT